MSILKSWDVHKISSCDHYNNNRSRFFWLTLEFLAYLRISQATFLQIPTKFRLFERMVPTVFHGAPAVYRAIGTTITNQVH